MFREKYVTELLFYIDKYCPSWGLKQEKKWIYWHKVQGTFWELVDKTQILYFLKLNIVRKVSDGLKWTQLLSFAKTQNTSEEKLTIRESRTSVMTKVILIMIRKGLGRVGSQMG